MRLATFVKVSLFSPTRRFPPRTLEQLSFDCDRGALNGVQFGSSIAALEPFGQASGYERLGEMSEHLYPRLGLTISTDVTGVLGFAVSIGPSAGMRYLWRGFEGGRIELRAGARAITVSGSTEERELVALLGHPGASEEFDSDVELYWYRERCMLSILVDTRTRRVTQIDLDQPQQRGNRDAA